MMADLQAGGGTIGLADGGKLIDMAALSDEEMATWADVGLLGPFRAIGTSEAAHSAEDISRQLDGTPGDGTMNRHSDVASIRRLCDQPHIWDSVSQLFGGTSLVLWRSNVFRGNPTLPWHEDSHAGLMAGPDASISVVIALTDNLSTNCMLYAPGSHRLPVAEKERRYGIVAEPKPGGNVRYRGTLPPNAYKRLLPQAGECAIFHPSLLHASSGQANGTAAGERFNIVFRLTTPATRILPAAYAEPAAHQGPTLIHDIGPGGSGIYRTPARQSDRR